MKKLRVWLSALLLLQVLLAAGIFMTTRSGQAGHESIPLLAIEQSTINKIMVNSTDDEVTLLKNDSGWLLPELNALPVNAGKLEVALNKLAGLQSSWPVTTTANSHQRFEVSADKYQRRIRLYQDDKLVDEIYLGTSPGFRKVHVRSADDNNVYALAINTYDFPARKQEWFDKGLLSVKDVMAIRGPDYALRKTGTQWQFEDSAEDEAIVELDADKANQLSQAFSSFRVTGVADKVPEFTSENSVNIAVSAAHKWHYQLLEKDKQYFVKRNDREQAFTLSEDVFNRLASVTITDLKLAREESSTKNDLEPDVPNAVDGG